MSVLDTLKAATPNRRSIKLCVDGAAHADWEALVAQLEQAAKDDEHFGSMAFEHTSAVVEQMDTVRDRMMAAEVTFTLERIPWEDRVALQADHPPRPDSLVDRVRGYNLTTFYPALIRASVVAVTNAAGDTSTDIPDDVWAGLLGDPEEGITGSLSAGQINQLRQAAEVVNDGESGAVPPSARSLLGSQDSGASLAQPAPGTSHPDASTDGNRPGSAQSSEKTTDGSPES